MSTQPTIHPIAAELPPHGYIITKPVPGSDIPADYTFVMTRDEIYVPIAVRKPKGTGPWPAILMGRGNGRGGLPLVEQKVALYNTMQEKMLARGYVVVYVNYRNEIPYHYETRRAAHNVADDIANETGKAIHGDWHGQPMTPALAYLASGSSHRLIGQDDDARAAALADSPDMMEEQDRKIGRAHV